MIKNVTFLLAILGMVVGLQAQIPTDGLVAYYPFNGNAIDESGNGIDGTVVDAISTVDRFGNENSAFAFDGNSGTERYIYSNIGLQDTVTFSAWFKAPNPTTNYPLIFNYGTSNNTLIQLLGNNPSYISGGHVGKFGAGSVVNDGPVWAVSLVSDKRYDDLNWHFAVVSFVPNDKLYLYIDNQLVNTAAYTANYPTDDLLYIGRQINDNAGGILHGTHFNGSIDDVRIYDRMLNEEEIESIFEEGGWSSLNSGLVAYYPFNGNANDESGNDLNGTVNGAILTTDRFGNANHAYSFDGSSNIRVSNDDLLNVPSGKSITISCWVKHDLSAPNVNTYIISKYGGHTSIGAAYAVGTETEGNGYSWHQIDADAANGREIRGTSKINDGNWHHFVSVISMGETVSLFIDGVLDEKRDFPLNGSIINALDLYFGCGANLAQHYKGSIDDIRIYNRALNSTEINSLYQDNGYADLTDIDGNTYKTVKIGTQTWMAENLKTTKYQNGDAIPNVTDNADWSNLTTGAYSWYDNDAAAYKDTYGALYNWYTVETGNLCPSGWHVPMYSEWRVLTEYLGGGSGKLKEAGTEHWLSPNTDATNESGFSALPAGGRGTNPGDFVYLGETGIWWTSLDTAGTYAGSYWNPYVVYDNSMVLGNPGVTKGIGMSIRCLKDAEITDEFSIHIQDVTVNEGQVLEVPISVSELSAGDNIISYQFDIDFDNTVLEYTGNDIVGTLAEGGTVDVNTGVAGKLSISYMTSTAIVGTGDILKLQFNTLVTDTTELFISNAYLNSAVVDNLSNGIVIVKDVTAPTAAITYNDTDIKYGDNLIITATFSEPMLASNAVNISLSGAADLADAVMTRQSETVYTYNYSVPKAYGDVTVSLSSGTDLWSNEVVSTPTSGDSFTITGLTLGDVDDDGKILAYDAALTLQHSVGLNPLPVIDALPWENWRESVANVDGAVGITANDAGMILQYSAGIITDFLGSTKKSAPQAFISMEFVEKGIIFYSYGELLGLNVSVDSDIQILGEPIVLAENFMSAFNINDAVYRVGLCTSHPPADGEAILKIPFNESGSVNINMIVNDAKKSMALNLSTGITDFGMNGISIYPNPAKDFIIINTGNYSNMQDYSIQIVNLLGATVFETRIEQPVYELNLSTWTGKGVYLVKIIDNTSQEISMKKIVLQ